MQPLPTFLSDDEVRSLCAPLRQPAAQVRYLRERLGLTVIVPPSGRPVVLRSEVERIGRPAANDPGAAADRAPGLNLEKMMARVSANRRGKTS